ncbi:MULTISPECIES: HAD family hydrolase [Leptolyngbya]|uniref:HAD family hydrolase n=1 Tax=Leptolyngbya TaxID=47251 RepID=UPI00168205EC|nr:HAD-IIIA family hydrolase [Leptolyngbya sp. FACHB-1624]MBD1855060.1 HAD-IIIA family hydrolase [Leptolyngbya sp. FACHB-1624]
MVKSILFDLDDTLLDRNTSVQQFIAAQYDRLSRSFNHVSKADYVGRFIELDCHGRVWKDQVYQALVVEFGIETIRWQALLEDYETQFQWHCIPFPFLTETLHQLKLQGYLLGIVTNGLGHVQNRSIDGLEIRDYFDTILISEVEQVRKPEPEIFSRALARLGATAQNSVFVGDHPKADIEGAKGVGMKTIWKQDFYWLETPTADATIDHLNEIPAILQQFDNN